MELTLQSAPLFWDIMVVLLGASIGSFTGVLIARLPEDLSVVQPPSYCFRCGHPISWYDNLPLLSYWISGGKCRHCGGHFSPGHFFIELYVAALTWLLWRFLGPTWELFPAWMLTWLLIPISVIDAREQIIPDELSIGGLVIALGLSFLPGGLSPQEAALAALAGGGALWAVAAAYLKLRGHEGMGTGDFKLLAMIGAFVGLKSTLLAVMVASVVGSVLGGGYLLLSRAGRRTPIPFGPFLALGGFLALLFPEEILSLYARLVGSVL